jgi:glycosyltransferase involved in cell wall biosynthesis
MRARSLRVALFSLAYRPFMGGAEVAIQEIARRIPSCRFTCFTHRFDSSWQRHEVFGNTEVVRLGRGGMGDRYGQRFGKLLYVFRAWKAAERAHRREPFGVIWAVMASYGGFAALLFKLRHPEVPFVLTLQEGDSEEHILGRVGVLYPVWRMIFRRADRIQVISSYLADFGRRHGATCPIEVIPNGVNLEQFQSLIPHSREGKGGSFTVITTSRLVEKNGIDTLIRACALLPEKFQLMIVGGGPLGGSLKALAAKLGIAHRVAFIGSVPPESVPGYLRAADVFVRASRSEGLGSSFLEAMAAGLPIVGTPVGGIVDFLRDGETGLMAPPDDSVGLAEKIAKLDADGALKEKLIARGRSLVQEKYDWDTIAHKFEEFLFLSFERRESSA